jgi:hypothetical protein
MRVFALFLCACAPSVIVPSPIAAPVVASETPLDTAPKEPPRLVPAEVYLRTYLGWFSTNQPMQAQERAKSRDGEQLFDKWSDYLGTLGFPDYRHDLPRATESNALMVAAFERLSIAVCDRGIENDLVRAVPVEQRTLFAFDVPHGLLTRADFDARFDVLHRTFLGYPASLAPPARAEAFYNLYKVAVERRREKSRLTPELTGWAVVCYGLARHPEAHVY